MISKFYEYSSYSEVENLIEDTFTYMCDGHGLDFRLMDGIFINTLTSDEPSQWMTIGLLDECKKLFNEAGKKLNTKKAYQVTFMKSETWSTHWIGEISDKEKVEKLNKMFEYGINKFNKMSKGKYELCYLPDEIKETFWQIVFYVVEN